MTRIEDLPETIVGNFEGDFKPHFDPRFPNRALADGTITYVRSIDGTEIETTIPVEGVSVRRLHGMDGNDFRRYVRVERGKRGEKKDKIIGLIDK